MSGSSRKQVKEKVIGKLDAALDVLYDLWGKIGIDEVQMGKRAGTVAVHLVHLLDEMVSEEQQMHDEMALNIQRYFSDLSTLCQEMHLPPFQVADHLSMVQKEKELRVKLESVKQEKQDRMGRLRQLLEEDEALCQSLCSTPFYVSRHNVPTSEQLQQLEDHVKDLQAEKEKRQQQFLSTKKKVLILCREIDYKPETSLEQDLICDDDDAVQLTKEHMTSVENILHDLERKNKELQGEAEDLWTRIHSLWDRIDLSDDQRTEFSSCHKGHSRDVVSDLQAEVHRCEQLKHTNLRRYIEGVRKEIKDWWDRCYYSARQRDAFTLYQEEVYSEELLQQHEQELKRLQDYYKANQSILDLVAKREKLWKNMVEFEKAASDPQRFFNDRGGKFLKEEKARNKLMKELPKLDEDVKEEMEKWEEEHGRQFLVEGMSYQQYVDQQWAHLRQQKEHEKEERHKNRAKQMEEEMIFGSKPTPNTPVKRRFANTPNRTPLKARKADENHRTPATVGRTAQPRQPLSVMKPSNTAMNKFRRRSLRQARKCLRESMQKASVGRDGVAKGTENKVQPNLFSHTTKGLNQTARPNCRSSVVPSSVASPHRPR